MQQEQIKVFVAEDDPLLCQLLSDILAQEEDLQVVGQARSGKEVLLGVLTFRPQVLLLDLNLPELSGWGVMDEVAELEDAPKVLVLSGEATEEVQVEALKHGAMGFQAKQGGVGRLPKAIRTVAAGQVWGQHHLVGRAIKELAVIALRSRMEHRPLARLSEREREILICIAQGKTNPQIARERFISVSTVKVHIQQIFQKLGLPNRAEAAVFAVREGLLREDEVVHHKS